MSGPTAHQDVLCRLRALPAVASPAASKTHRTAAPSELSIESLLRTVGSSASAQILAESWGQGTLGDLTEREMRDAGLTLGAARKLACMLELQRRMALRAPQRGTCLRSSADIAAHYKERFRHEMKEHFLALLLSAKNRLIREEVVSIGILTASLVHPREVFRTAIRHAAGGIVLLHNHPSGDPEPSPEDRDVTRRLAAVGDLVGIRVLDHVIVAGGGSGAYVSFLERGLMP